MEGDDATTFPTDAPSFLTARCTVLVIVLRTQGSQASITTYDLGATLWETCQKGW
jgi:hypothetical protein